MLRSLGKTGLEIAPLVFGGNVLGHQHDDRDGDQVFRQQDRHAQARSVIRIRRLNR